ncbi:MAG: hypothetical protein IBX61_02690 [Thermoleophilia bacterium]|nr:hypothetical protein [Thermoleophilia bacterium]
MDCYLCKYCKTVANFVLTGPCLESPTGQHECVSGEDVAERVMMLWDRTPAEPTNLNA